MVTAFLMHATPWTGETTRAIEYFFDVMQQRLAARNAHAAGKVPERSESASHVALASRVSALGGKRVERSLAHEHRTLTRDSGRFPRAFLQHKSVRTPVDLASRG